MVKVNVLIEANQIKKIVISGHANSAPHGQDLVCASVSAVGVGLLNSLDEFASNSCDLFMDEGLITVVVNSVNSDNQLICKVAIKQLETIEYSYNQFINITKQEV